MEVGISSFLQDENMIKNIIILGLLFMLITGVSTTEVVAYVEDNQLIDKLSEMLYNVVRSVKNNV